MALALVGLCAAALQAPLAKLTARLDLSRAKHRSLAGHARLARRVASLIPFYAYDEERFFRSDDPPQEIAARRRAGFMRLSELYQNRFAKTAGLTAEVEDIISDVQFTGAYRVPFQYRQFLRHHLDAGSFVQSSAGVTLTDLDGNRFFDLTGSYGVNVFGYEFYKECMERAHGRVAELGPVSGAYHPVVADNAKRLRQISGLDEVSFHMSGTEAVMQAVQLARYHTRRPHLVRFCGAYHGWWGDVQPGLGNPLPARATYTLKDMSDDRCGYCAPAATSPACSSIHRRRCIPTRAPRRIWLWSTARDAPTSKRAYTDWLQRLRAVCTQQRIVLIFDEVFVGFRLAPGGNRRISASARTW